MTEPEKKNKFGRIFWKELLLWRNFRKHSGKQHVKQMLSRMWWIEGILKVTIRGSSGNLLWKESLRRNWIENCNIGCWEATSEGTLIPESPTDYPRLIPYYSQFHLKAIVSSQFNHRACLVPSLPYEDIATLA